VAISDQRHFSAQVLAKPGCSAAFHVDLSNGRNMR
jgi:hypothetical protein